MSNNTKAIYTMVIEDNNFPQRVTGFDETKGSYGEYSYQYKSIISTNKYPVLDKGYHIYTVKPLSHFFGKDYTYDEVSSKIGLSIFTVSRQAIFTSEQVEKVVITPIDEQTKKQQQQKRAEILSKVYDLQQYDLNKYNAFKRRINQIFVEAFKRASIESSNSSSMGKIARKERYYSFKWVPSYAELWNKSQEKKFRYTISSAVYLKSSSNGYIVLDESKTRSEIGEFTLNDSGLSMINGSGDRDWSEYWYLDAKYNLTIDGYEVKVGAEIPVVIDYAKGVTEVRIRRGELEFVNYIPDDDLVEKIRNELYEKLPKSNGRLNNTSYIVLYAYSNINDNISLHVEYNYKNNLNIY